MKYLLSVLLFCLGCSIHGQIQQKIQLNKEYKDIVLTKTSTLVYTLPFVKEGTYQFSILQQGIAVYYTLTSADNQKLYESNYPDDITGYERFEYSPGSSGHFTLTIKRFEDPENPDSGKIAVLVKSLTKAE